VLRQSPASCCNVAAGYLTAGRPDDCVNECSLSLLLASLHLTIKQTAAYATPPSQQ